MTEAVGPLTGRLVLVTRPSGRAAPLIAALKSLGAEAVARPTIAFEGPHDPEPVAEAIGRLAAYDWIVFTSPTGVRAFRNRLHELDLELRTETRLAAVGPGTARALLDNLRKATVVASDSRSEGLARALRDQVRAGERVLVVRPETASSAVSDTLQKIGASVDPVAFYRTVAAPDVEELVSEIVRGRFDAAVFTSPSTFGRLLEGAGALRDSLGRALEALAIVAIGSVTVEAIRQAGLEPSAVASEPTPHGLAEAVASCFQGCPAPVVPCGPFGWE